LTLSKTDHFKAAAFRQYRKVRQVLSYNIGERDRPGRTLFIVHGRTRMAALEEEYPDFPEKFAEIFGSRYPVGD
jgi:hypothetical protein